MSYTEKRVWVAKHLGLEFVECLIICPDKSLLKCNYLINVLASGREQENFEDQLIHFGTETFKNWEDVIRVFKNLSKLKPTDTFASFRALFIRNELYQSF